MSNGTGLSRGDRNCNEKLGKLRALVPAVNAIAAFDLADDKQMLVVTDHDSRVLARRRLRCKAWHLGPALEWAAARAAEAGSGGVTVSCKPAGHRWRVLGQLAAGRGMPFVFVQTLLVAWACRNEDLTCDKTDERDAMLIARLTGELHCYDPEAADETWARLRHLGARRERLAAESTAAVQQIRDLLECAWPAVLARANGDPARLRRLGAARFEAAVRRELPRWGGQKPRLRIVRAVFTALTGPTGVAAQRPGALERAGLLLEDWRDTQRRSAGTETRMLAILDDLHLTDLVTSIDGLSAVAPLPSLPKPAS